MDEARAALPDVYTVLVTDLQDSTRLWERHPEAMEAVIAGAHRLAHVCVTTHGGSFVKSTGDGVLALFGDAADAVAAAADIQRQAMTLEFAGVGRVHLRVGLNTGPCRPAAGDVVGRAPNLAARLQDIGHGGQILLSATTAAACRGRLTPDVRVRDLGPYLIRGFDEAVIVHTVEAADLETSFPPLRARGHRSGDLPGDDGEMFGRADTVADVLGMIGRHRLITIWGPGGVGKTKLATRVANAGQHLFADGVHVVELPAAGDSDAIAQAIVVALRAQQISGESPMKTALRVLAGSHVLLVIDECERVVEKARAVIDEVLVQCHFVSAVATSRTPLESTFERTVELLPLAVPGEGVHSAVDLALNPSVQMLTARVAESVPTFRLTDANAADIAALCRAADGLPLALELISARVAVEGLGAHVGDISESLTRLVSEMSRTETDLFLRLVVLTGSFARPLAIQMSEDPTRAASTLDRLVRRALVKASSDSPPTYRILGPLRQAALNTLDNASRRTIEESHARVMLDRAESMAPMMRSNKEAVVVAAFEAEFAEYRTALAFLLGHGDPADAARLVVALFPFCLFQPRPEVQVWAAAAANALKGDEPCAAEVIGAAAVGAWFGGDTAGAIALAERALEVVETNGGSDHWARIALVDAFGYAGDVAAGAPHFSALVGSLRLNSEVFWQIHGLGFEAIGFAMFGAGDSAQQRAEQALSLARRLGNPDCLFWAFYALGRSLALADGRGACAAFEEAMRAARAVHSEFNAGLALIEWVGLERRLGEHQLARSGAVDLLDLLAVSGNRSQLSQALREVGLLVAEDRSEVAALALLARQGLPSMPSSGVDTDVEVARALASLESEHREVWIQLRLSAIALPEAELLAKCRVALEDLRLLRASPA